MCAANGSGGGSGSSGRRSTATMAAMANKTLNFGRKKWAAKKSQRPTHLMESLGVRVTDTCRLVFCSNFSTEIQSCDCAEPGHRLILIPLGLLGLLDSGCRVSQPSSQSVGSSLISVFFLLRSVFCCVAGRSIRLHLSSIHSAHCQSVGSLSLSPAHSPCAHCPHLHVWRGGVSLPLSPGNGIQQIKQTDPMA